MEPHHLESNLWAVNRDFRRIPGATVHDDEGLLWYSCPGANSWLNGASRCTLGDDAEAAVGQAVTTWDELGVAVMWHQTPTSRPARLPEILASHGFEAEAQPGMAMELGTTFEPRPQELAIDEIRDPAGVLDWVDTFDVAFGGDPRGLEHPWLAPFSSLYLGDDSPGRLFVGRVDEVAVATSLAFVGGGAVGLYGVGTIPDRRGRGYGAAVTIAGVEWGRSRGATLAVLEASDLGLPVYRRIGFESVFETTSWVRAAAGR